MRLLILALLVAPLLPFNTFGQSLKKVLEVGDESFENRDYYAAYQCYKTLLEYPDGKYDADSVYLKYRMALSAQRFNYFYMADSMYAEVLDADGVAGTAYEALAIYNRGLALYTMGTNELETPKVENPAQEIDPRSSNEVYAAAQQLFQDFVNRNLHTKLEGGSNLKARYLEAANIYIEECEEKLTGTVSIEDKKVVTRLTSKSINGPYSDIAPVVKGDQLYFSSLQHLPKPGQARRQSRTYSRVHRAQLSNANPLLDTAISQAVLQESDLFNINEDVHTVHTAFTADALQMFFSSCVQREDSIVCQLYRRWCGPDGQWGKPQKLTINIDNGRTTTTQPSVSIDCTTGKEWLYFASDRTGSLEGSLDIWRCEIRKDSTFSVPERLPDGVVNTRWDEATPFYHTPSKRLYFSSTAPPGYGMYDLFTVQQQPDGRWENRENMGLPINTGYNDQYYFLSSDGDRAYFSSDRPRSMRFRDNLDACCQDIYTQKIKVDIPLNIDLIVCPTDAPEGTVLAEVKIFEDNCGQRTELEGSPFQYYKNTPLSVEASRFKTYAIQASLPDGTVQEREVNLASAEYAQADAADVSLTLYPEQLKYTFIAKTPFDGEEKLSYHLVLQKDGTTLSEGNYTVNGSMASKQEFRLDPGSYTILVSNASGTTDASGDTALDYGEQSIDFTVLPLEQRMDLGDPCRDTVIMVLSRSRPPLPFPIIFYFDNDKPDRLDPDNNPRTYNPPDRAGQSYDEAYYDYIKPTRRQQYVEYNVNNTEGVRIFELENKTNPRPVVAQQMAQSEVLAKTLAESAINQFFDDDVIDQFKTFNNFMDALIDYLSGEGASLTIEIQGFCSPLGGRDYNKKLAKRRIECIRKYMTSYKDGALEQYITNGTLSIREDGIGITQPFTGTPTVGDPARLDYRALLSRRVEIKNVDGQSLNVGGNEQ